MSTCGTCFANVPSGAAFCPECGAKAPAGKTTTTTVSSSSAPTLQCSSCGFELPSGARFCPECGGKPAESGSSTSTPSKPQQQQSSYQPQETSYEQETTSQPKETTSQPKSETKSSSSSSVEGGTCAGCGKEVSTRILTALDKTWHPDCFKCAGCGTPFSTSSGGGSFLIKDDKPYCNSCVDKMMGVCASCNGKLTGQVLTALDKQWHPACFVCTGCRKPFTGGKFKVSQNNPGRPYCDDCVKKA